MTYAVAQPSDIARISELFVEMLCTVYRTDSQDGYAPHALDHYFGGEDKILTAVDGGKIVAFLSVEMHRENINYLYLDDFSVTADYRNRGIGTALLARAEAYAREKALGEVYLHVEQSNACAMRLYQRLGFSVREVQGSRFLMVKPIQ